MSNEKKETVMDIVAEKRRGAQDILSVNDTPGGRREALDLTDEADRIEAAYWRHEVELRDLKCENANLLAALKPVLGIVIPPDEDRDSNDECECKWCCFGDSECWRGKGRIVMSAVREAQRIYISGDKTVKPEGEEK